MSSRHYPDVNYLIRLAEKAGKIIRVNFSLDPACIYKDDDTPVTITDIDINHLVLSTIGKDYPLVEVMSEEGSLPVDGAEYRIMCDPVDDTLAFTLGIPVSSFCISVVRGNIPLVAVIYDPFMKRMWVATKGDGAWLRTLDGVIAIKVSGNSGLHRSRIFTTWWANADYNLLGVCRKLMDEKAVWSSSVSVAYAGGLIASGMFEASIFPGRNCLETAAMQLIVEEAGGIATDIHGNPLEYGPKGEMNGHIISNGKIHDRLVKLVASCQA